MIAMRPRFGWQGDWRLSATLEAPPESRVARLVARGLTREQARIRIAAQTTDAERAAQADVVIRNMASLEELEAAATIFYHKLESMPT